MNHALQRMTALLLAGVLAGSGMTAAALATPEQAATPEAAAPVLPPEVPAATPEQTEPAALDAAVPDAAAAPRAAGQVVEGTVSPIGTTINLFDYWITTRDAPDNTNPPDLDQGINAGKALIFTANPGRGGSINNYTGSANPRTGMVLPTLQEGYPQLTASGQSLNYLFKPRPAQRWQGLLPQRAGSFADRRGRLLLLQLHPGFRPVRRGFQHLYPLHPAGCAHRRVRPRCWDSSFPSTTTSRSRASTPATLPSTTISA